MSSSVICDDEIPYGKIIQLCPKPPEFDISNMAPQEFLEFFVTPKFAVSTTSPQLFAQKKLQELLGGNGRYIVLVTSSYI